MVTLMSFGFKNVRQMKILVINIELAIKSGFKRSSQACDAYMLSAAGSWLFNLPHKFQSFHLFEFLNVDVFAFCLFTKQGK